MECQQDARLRRIVNHSGLSTPDGMPLVWLSRWHGHKQAGRVYGPDLMLALCERSQTTGHRHYFYGGRPGVAESLVTKLRARFPGLQVAGAHAPPMRPAGAIEDAPVIEMINRASPDVVWVGLGTPKQDFWAGLHRPLLAAPVIIAIGAAFDFHAGLLKQAPAWMQRSGLEWLFRLSQEPRRLAYRYLVYNPMFMTMVAMQLAGVSTKPLD
jgi:N-acetylglucosaminyldiphosphoundecaprenol N-acetyl-beta-D-mannosaminyltransferase